MFHFAGVLFRGSGRDSVSDEETADYAVFLIDGGSVIPAFFGEIEMFAVLVDVTPFAERPPSIRP